MAVQPEPTADTPAGGNAPSRDPFEKHVVVFKVGEGGVLASDESNCYFRRWAGSEETAQDITAVFERHKLSIVFIVLSSVIFAGCMVSWSFDCMSRPPFSHLYWLSLLAAPTSFNMLSSRLPRVLWKTLCSFKVRHQCFEYIYCT